MSALLAFLAQVTAPAVELEVVKSAAEGRVHLWGDLFLADPWFLLLLPIGVAGLLYGRSRRGRSAAFVPTLPGMRPPKSVAQSCSWVPLLLQVLSLVLVVTALSRPLRGNVQLNTRSEGVDLALLVDRSSSMGSEDLEAGHSRLSVVKEVVTDFAVRRMTDRDGASDYVALFTFARYPQELCPFTLDVEAITGFLEKVELARDRAEDSTGIGIALAKAVAVLKESEARSKVIVLLTDGENNLDLISPLDAAKLAAEEGVRVYSVFAGRYVMDVFGRMRQIDAEIDTRELQQVARMTGGRFFRARDRKALEQAYAEIEELERTPRQEQRFVEHYDLYPALLYAALAFYLVSWFSASTWARRLP